MSSDDCEYDESSYPCGADSLDEEDDNARPSHLEALCAVCAQVLMDPMTLGCGHSFCQICLARLWQSKLKPPPANLLCPSCRQPWVQLPGINIQLRSIVEGAYANDVSERRACLTDEDKSILAAFSNIKTTHRSTLQQQDIGRLVQVFICLFLGLAICVVVGGALLVWVWSGARGEYMRKPVKMWSSSDVVDWVEELGEWTSPNITRIFQVQALTGPQLLMLDDQALVQFGMEGSFRRQTILQAVEQLKALDYSPPHNFFQFKAAHRRTTLLLTLFYTAWPRFTLLYTYLFEYYTVYLPLGRAQFTSQQDNVDLSWLQQCVLTIQLLLFPHVAVCVLCAHWLSVHPFICVPVIVHCGVSMAKQVLFVYRTRLHQVFTHPVDYIKSQFLSSIRHLATFVAFVTVFLVIWPIIPHFLCDFIFYLTLWNTVLLQVNYLLRLC